MFEDQTIFSTKDFSPRFIDPRNLSLVMTAWKIYRVVSVPKCSGSFFLPKFDKCTVFVFLITLQWTRYDESPEPLRFSAHATTTLHGSCVSFAETWNNWETARYRNFCEKERPFHLASGAQWSTLPGDHYRNSPCNSLKLALMRKISRRATVIARGALSISSPFYSV